MSVEDEAFTEAEKRYSGRFSQPLTAGAVRNARREAYERGYIAGASRKVEITDDVILRARAEAEAYLAEGN